MCVVGCADDFTLLTVRVEYVVYAVGICIYIAVVVHSRGTVSTKHTDSDVREMHKSHGIK